MDGFGVETCAELDHCKQLLSNDLVWHVPVMKPGSWVTFYYMAHHCHMIYTNYHGTFLEGTSFLKDVISPVNHHSHIYGNYHGTHLSCHSHAAEDQMFCRIWLGLVWPVCAALCMVERCGHLYTSEAEWMGCFFWYCFRHQACPLADMLKSLCAWTCDCLKNSDFCIRLERRKLALTSGWSITWH